MVQFGRYQVAQQLGHGSMASVYLAKDPWLTRYVAIKVIHPHLASEKRTLQRFFKEARTVAQLRHPNIVEVFDLGQEARRPFLVMEFVQGQTLQKILEQLDQEPMDPVVAAAIMYQAAQGLAVAAHAGVVHRDLKPENLLVTNKGYLKISDFGICHLKDHTTTRTGAVLGTPQFMSPEQVNGESSLTHQADMFSMGAVFYYCLAGKPPFAAPTVASVFKKITSDPLPPLGERQPNLDPHLIELIHRLLEKDPRNRGGGAEWLQRHLRKYLLKNGVSESAEVVKAYLEQLAGRGFTTNWEGVPEIPSALAVDSEAGFQRRVRKRWFLWVGIPALVAVIAGSIVWLSRGFKEPDHVASQEKPLPLKQASAMEIAADGRAVALARSNPSDQKEPGATKPVERPSEALTPSEPKPVTSLRVPRKPGPEPFETRTRDTAVVSIHSAPPFAEVRIDGRNLGNTPLLNFKIPVGEYRVVLRYKLNPPLDTLIFFRPGNNVHRLEFPKDDEP